MTTTAEFAESRGLTQQSLSDIAGTAEVQMEKPERMRSGERCFSWIMTILSVVVLVLAYQISGIAVCAPGTFPLAAASVMVLAMTFVLIANYKRPGPDVKGILDELHRALNRLTPRIIVIYTCIIIGYMLILRPLHFFPATFIFLYASLLYLRGANWWKSLIICGGALVAVYVIFQFIFKVTLP